MHRNGWKSGLRFMHGCAKELISDAGSVEAGYSARTVNSIVYMQVTRRACWTYWLGTMRKIRALSALLLILMSPRASHAPASPTGIPAIVDLGSAFTIANWAAGKLAGLEPNGSNVKYNGQASEGLSAFEGSCASRGI